LGTEREGLTPSGHLPILRRLLNRNTRLELACRIFSVETKYLL